MGKTDVDVSHYPGQSRRPFQGGNEHIFLFITLLAYGAVTLLSLLFHPMWRDEIHPWAMAGASSSLGDLLHRKAVEGHPDLWYYILYFIRRFNSNPIALQLTHWSIAVSTVFLVLRFAPFPKFQRLMLVFGYFFLFEYAVISRNYAPGLLFLTLFLILSGNPSRNFLLMAVALFLMAQSNVFALIIAIALSLFTVYEILTGSGYRQFLLKRKGSLVAGILVTLAGIAWSVHSVIPPSAGYFAGSSHFSLSQLTLRETVHSIAITWRAWVPLPQPVTEFWDSHLLESEPTMAILSLALLFFAGMLFSRDRSVLLLFIAGSAGITAFILMYYYGYIRHHGHMFILLFACFWLLEQRSAAPREVASGLRAWLFNHRQGLFTALLAVQVLAGCYALTVHNLVPFSAGRECATFIRREGYDRYMLAGDQDVALETLTCYLDRDAFFFSRNAFSPYLIYDRRRVIPEPAAVLRMADSLVQSHGDTVLLALNRPLTNTAGLNARPVRSFSKSIVRDEKYYLYLLIPHKP